MASLVASLRSDYVPYVPKEDRPELDGAVKELSDEIVSLLKTKNGDTDLAVLYKEKITDVIDAIINREIGKIIENSTPPINLGNKIFDVAVKYNYRGAWLGELNYAITRLIQLVPYTLYKSGVFKEALRYWIYALTAGALEQVAIDFSKKRKIPEWVKIGIVGVINDIKDEYKRRVNTAYESHQIEKNGDCYEYSPYHTELRKTDDGFTEVMKKYEI
jgi:hypothetical protein